MSDRRTALGLLAALIALDLVLIFLALRPAPAPSPASAVPVQPSPSSSASPAASGRPTAFPPATAVNPLPRSLLVGVGGDGAALATTTSDCDAPGTAVAGVLPADGSTTTSADVPAPKVQRLGTLPNGTIYAISASQGCPNGLFTASTRPLGTWDQAIAPTGLAYLVPGSTADRVVLKDGQVVDTPCKVISLALTSGEDPRLLCADGNVQRLGLGGWTTGAVVSQGRALAAGAGSTLYALEQSPDCEGLVVAVSGNNGDSWSPTPCITGANPDGAVGIGFNGNTLLVVDASGRAFRATSAAQSFTTGQ